MAKEEVARGGLEHPGYRSSAMRLAKPIKDGCAGSSNIDYPENNRRAGDQAESL